MTCKDCIHYSAPCKNHFVEKYYRNAENCPTYQNNSKFIESQRTVYILNEVLPVSGYRIDTDVIKDTIYRTHCCRQFSKDEIGKTVFLSKEQAEWALKELQERTEVGIIKVKDLIKELSLYNPEADVSIVVGSRDMPFTICYGSGEGCKTTNCDYVYLLANSTTEKK